ncbi:serine/threonine-protein phosphatase 4 regulatory subunit 1-like isoform X1 [Tigriopus californicus]|uniref:serine/threonine-protein phosphatase 4 regulatory subunit 1-like isoform X1 n=2 Tax=Tigriopus californicus TaxID=6832 RepID=UPI0027DA8FAF|nr:serine/threonine-protein phosphatase 4 regulatory subunit 1-like isoform X1 [Tigriopus californicus]
MADIYFYQEDENEEDHEEDDPNDEGSAVTIPRDLSGTEDPATHVQKLEKYAQSENLFNRQIVARMVLETLRFVADFMDEVDAVLQVMNGLANDPESSVRAELMEQIPHIAMFCRESKPNLSHVVPKLLLPIVVNFLTDNSEQARKTSQAALLVLLEQGLVERSHVEEQVCPVILELTDRESLDNLRTEAVALLSKIAPLIGRGTVKHLFLDRFASLCVDPLFHVRKVCASNFGEFAAVVGPEATENVLLPKFFYLCEDGVWGVRKACSDVFMSVSCECSPSTRRTELVPIFLNLLRDQSRWVRMAAYQALGPFISTFADPSLTALLQNDNGEILVTDREKLSFRLDELESGRAKKSNVKEGNDDVIMDESPGDEPNDRVNLVYGDEDQSPEEKRAGVTKKVLSTNYSSTQEIDTDEEQNFNDFLYWRDPPGSIDLDKDGASGISSTPSDEMAKLSLDSKKTEERPEAGSPTEPTQNEGSWQKLPIITFQTFDDLTSAEETGGQTLDLFRPVSTDSSSSNQSTFDPKWNQSYGEGEGVNPQDYPPDPALPKYPPATIQSIVPQSLIDHYVSMIDPSRAQTVDTDISRHCAYSLPAVALTLGRANWPLLRSPYIALASDMQWKVRRTLASSIHEMGVILGKEIAATDLIPIFDGFLKDLDEVRIGLLKHLADFLQLLNPVDRDKYLKKLGDFRKMDNERNWRFRQELTYQLEKLTPCFSAPQVLEFITPVAYRLCTDRVASVRSGAASVVAVIIKHIDESPERYLSIRVVANIVEDLAERRVWTYRQTFVNICYQIHQIKALDAQNFNQNILPYLLDLSEDRVPNVRLAVSRTLSIISKESPDFLSIQTPNKFNWVKFQTVEKNLKNDSDVDVRFFFGGAAKYYPSENLTESENAKCWPSAEAGESEEHSDDSGA